MPITPPAAVKELLDVYDDLVQGATDLTGAAAAIAPAAVRDILCTAGGLASLLGGPLGPFQGPDSQARQASDLGGILQAACPVPPPVPQFEPTQGPPPFTGGQCPGVLYRINYAQQFEVAPGQPNEQTVTQTGVAQQFGPIGQFSGPPPGGNPSQKSIGITHANGIFITLTSTPAANPRYSSFVVTRSDNQPDTCGDPPGPINPPDPIAPIPDQPESPVIPPSVPDPGIPGGGGFIFKPEVGPITIGPDGGINVPVVVNIGGPSLNIPITIPVNVSLPDFAPTIVIGGSGGVSGGPGPVVPPTPPEPICCRPLPRVGPVLPGEEGEPVEGEEPPFRGRLIGVVVSAVVNANVAAITEIGQGGGDKNLWVPRLGSLYFTTRAKNENSSTVIAGTIDYPVKTLQQFIEVPRDVEVVGFRAVPEPGVAFSTAAVVVPKNPSSDE